MPNFHTKTLNYPSLPFSEDGYTFLWDVDSKDSKLVLVKKDREQFFLTIHKKDKSFLVKGEKISRPTQVIYLQEALSIYAKHSDSKLISSNINPASNRYKKSSTILKNIDFFASNPFKDCSKEILLEVGFGSGRHLLHQAKQNKNAIIIGVEIHKPSIEQVIKQCDILELDNIYIIDYDARTLLEFLPSNLLSKIFVHFPIPWDKKPHRRVISKTFVDEAIRTLKVDGTLELRTDSDLYYEYSLEIFENADKQNVKVLKNQDLEVSSKYEDRWKKMQKSIYDIALTNKTISNQIVTPYLISFDSVLDFDKINLNFKEKVEVMSNLFVHFETIYKSLEYLVIKLAFGDTQRAEHSFLVVEKSGKSYYLPKSIYATHTNIKAHNVIKEWLNE